MAQKKPAPISKPVIPQSIKRFNEAEDRYQQRIEEYEREHLDIPEARKSVREGKVQSPWLMVLRPRFRGINQYHPKYATADEMREAMDMYIEWCYRTERQVTMVGMARFLGFSGRRGMEDYANIPRDTGGHEQVPLQRDPEFPECIAYAHGLIEHWTLERAMEGKIPATIAKLILNQHGYHENAQSEVDDVGKNLSINKAFLESLGAGGAVQIKRGDDVKTPTESGEGANESVPGPELICGSS